MLCSSGSTSNGSVVLLVVVQVAVSGSGVDDVCGVARWLCGMHVGQSMFSSRSSLVKNCCWFLRICRSKSVVSSSNIVVEVNNWRCTRQTIRGLRCCREVLVLDECGDTCGGDGTCSNGDSGFCNGEDCGDGCDGITVSVAGVELRITGGACNCSGG